MYQLRLLSPSLSLSSSPDHLYECWLFDFVLMSPLSSGTMSLIVAHLTVYYLILPYNPLPFEPGRVFSWKYFRSPCTHTPSIEMVSIIHILEQWVAIKMCHNNRVRIRTATDAERERERAKYQDLRETEDERKEKNAKSQIRMRRESKDGENEYIKYKRESVCIHFHERRSGGKKRKNRRKKVTHSDGHPASLSTGRIVSLGNTVQNISALSFQLHFVTYVLLLRHEMQLLSLCLRRKKKPNGISELAIQPVLLYRHIFLHEFLSSMNPHKLLTNTIVDTSSFVISTEKKLVSLESMHFYPQFGKINRIPLWIAEQGSTLYSFTSCQVRESSSMVITSLPASQSIVIIGTIKNIRAVRLTITKKEKKLIKIKQTCVE